MKFFQHKYFFPLILLFVIGNQLTSDAAVWIQKAAFGGTVRQFATGFAMGGKGYIGTGWDYTIGLRNDFWEYDPATNTWTQKTNFGGVSRALAVGFAVGSKGYICTGQDSYGGLKDLWEFDPVSNTWTQKANFGGALRSSAVGFGIGARGYVGTGLDANTSTFFADFWEYNPTSNVWTKKADFGGGLRKEAVGLSIGNKGYIGTGNDLSVTKKDFWQYNPANNTWTQKANIGTVMYLPIGFSIGSKGYVGIGYGPSGQTKDFWEYDTLTNTWTKNVDFGGIARFAAVGFSIGLKGYVGTGQDILGVRTNDFWEYQPTYIFTGNIGLTKICISKTASIPINVPYTVTSSFNPGNIFTAQISDSSGSFTSPLNIGTKADTLSGTINAVIPPNMTYGNKYRIRVISSSPSLIGSDNKKDLSLNPKPVPGMTINDTLQCFAGNIFNFANTSTLPFGTIGQTLWSFGDAKTANTLITSHTYSLDGTYTVKMKTVSDSGCADSLKKFVRILIAPNASFTSSDTGMCFMGNSFTFTNKTTIKSGTVTYKWYTGSNDSSTITDLTYSYPNPGKFNLKLVAYSNIGCNDTATQLIQVDSIPNINFTINDSAQCIGSNMFVFTNKTTNANTYYWSFGDGDTSTSKDITHLYISENTFNVKLKAFSNPKCFDSLIKKVNIYPDPVASFSVDKDTQCLSGNIFNFTNLSTIKSGSFNSLWNFDDGNTSNSPNTNHSYATAQTFNVTLVVTSNNGCRDSIIKPAVVRNSITLTKTSNNGPICEGQTLELYTDTIPFAKYSWTFPNGKTDTTRNPVIDSANASHNGTYTVTATSLMGCVSLPTTTDVVVKPLPARPEADSIVDVCQGASLNLNATLPVPNATFNWTGPNGFTSTIPDPIIDNMTLAKGGKYQVKATVDGCEGPPSNVLVKVHFNPKVDMGKDTDLCKGDERILDPGLFTSYMWQDGTTDRKYSVKDKGKYWVEVESEYGCFGSDTIVFGDLCPPSFFVPTAFSPNADLWNNVFIPQGNNIFNFNMKIYDKWGSLIFETNSLEIGWDGKNNGVACPVDLYYWYATWFSTWQGQETNNAKYGGVYIIR